MPWEIEYDGSRSAIDEYGITDLVRVRKNLLTDKATFKIPKSSLFAEPTFDPNSRIKIFHDNVKWFEGIVTQVPLYCSGIEEEYEYEVSGPWWYLENIIYQQAWNEPIDAELQDPVLHSVYKSRVIIGQNINGESLTVGDQIRDVLAYAISCGAVLSIGSIDIPVNIPFDECRNLSCADIVRRLLRWVPDTVCCFDYSKNIPAVSFKRRNQLSKVELDLLDNVSEFSIRPMFDLQVPAVILCFETTNSCNGKTWKESVVQKYPTTATGFEISALILTINLEGSKSNYIVQEISTEEILPYSVDWWKAHVPGLSALPTSSISISNVSRTSNLPNELISGSIASWMDKSVEHDVVRCKISYFDENEHVVGREIAVRLVATNASTCTFKKLMSLTTAESVPQNLAKQIYDSVNPLQYDGKFVTISSEVSYDFFGKLINFSNGQSAWESMDAVVQEVVEKVDVGKIFVKFGPSKHLGAADLAELTRSGRLLYESSNSTERITAEASGNGVVEQGIYSRVDNTSFGTGKYKMINFSDPSSSGKTVRIDTGDVVATGSATIKFREEYVCDSGVLKKRYSLASEPYSTA